MAERRDHIPKPLRRAAYRVVYSLTIALGTATTWLATGYREGTVLERLLILPVWLPFRLAFNTCFILVVALAGEAGRRVAPRD
jgi:hypothetical protein